MLGTTSMGAVWACCSAELGPTAVIDRLGQIQPRVLFTADEYVYGGRGFNMLPSIEKIVRGLPSLKRVVIDSRVDKPDWKSVPGSVAFGDMHASDRAGDAGFQQLPADHPVYIMFTSGTTGKPKCIVQGAAGLLVNQLKEVLLHADLKKTDRVMYITSPSWMMWNWLMSCLAVGATIILYDGNPNYPDWGSMWRLVQEEKATFFGCSASYINHLRSLGAKPGKNYDLSSLREDVTDSLSSLSGGFRVGLPRGKGGFTPQLYLRRNRHQRLLCRRNSHPSRLYRRATGPRARDEDQRLRRERKTHCRHDGRTGLRGPSTLDAPVLLGRPRRQEVPRRLFRVLPA